MSKLLTVDEMGGPIIKALGLDGKVVRSMTLRLRAGKLPSVVVEHWVRDDSGKIIAAIGPAFSRYELTLREPTP